MRYVVVEDVLRKYSIFYWSWTVFYHGAWYSIDSWCCTVKWLESNGKFDFGYGLVNFYSSCGWDVIEGYCVVFMGGEFLAEVCVFW